MNINSNDFLKSIKDHKLEPIYLFSGPDAYLKQSALDAIRAALLPEGLEQLNEDTLENCSAQAIIDSCETLPVMSEKRIVVVRDWAPLASGKAKNEENDVSLMLEWMKHAPESCVLIFFMSHEADGKKKLSKALVDTPRHVNFAHLAGANLMKWCNAQLKPYGKRLTKDAFEEMVLMAGQDLNRLLGELSKLAAYVENASDIGIEAVREVVTASPEHVIYTIIDHLLGDRFSEATQVVNAQLLTNTGGAIALIGMLTSQLRLDTHIKLAMEAGSNMADLIKALGISDWRARSIQRQIRHIPASALRERYLACVETDYAIKSGTLRDRAALNALMLRLLYPPRATK